MAKQAEENKEIVEKEDVKESTEVNTVEVLAQIKEAQDKLDQTAANIKEQLKELEAKSKALDEQMQAADEKAIELSTIPAKVLIDDSMSTGAALAKETQVTLVVPKSELNPQEKMVPVTINGYTYQILRGEQVTVPQTVADILKEAKYI